MNESSQTQTGRADEPDIAHKVDIADDSIFAKAEGMVISPAPDGYLVHEPVQDFVHVLNAPAALVYELCDGQHTVKAIEALFEEAITEAEPKEGVVRDCLVQLAAKKLILPCT